MKRCIEVLVYKVKPEKVDDFIAINKVRYAVLKELPGCQGVLLIKLPFVENAYIRMVIWESREVVIKYCDKRLQRERYLEFLRENTEDFAILFLDEIDLSDMASVSQDLIDRYFVKPGI
jgi:heme-degrading monooxygenase HmoA